MKEQVKSLIKSLFFCTRGVLQSIDDSDNNSEVSYCKSDCSDCQKIEMKE